MQISVVTDEISADPETAIELGVGWGVQDFELRGFYSDRVPRLSSYQTQQLRAVLDDYQARIVAISPGLFKIPYPWRHPPLATLAWMNRAGYEDWETARGLVRFHLDELLPASCDYANQLGAPLVVAFGFDRGGLPPGEPPDEVLNCLRLAAERVGRSGLQLVIETEAGFWADIGERTGPLIRAVDNPALGVNWDPGNVMVAGSQPYPESYEAVRGLVRHVHFKDVRVARDGQPEYVVEGEIDWAGQIGALAADGYGGFLSVETHMRPKVASAEASLTRLRALVAGTMAAPSIGGQAT